MENLAIIVLNYNSVSDSIKCVNQLLSFQETFHIVLVDNNSKDDSYEILKSKYSQEFFVDVIETGTNKGYSAGNNAGIHFAENQYHVDTVAILNPDVFIPNVQVIKIMLEKLYLDDSYAVVGGVTLDSNGNFNPHLSCWDIPTNKHLIIDHSLFYKSNSQNKNRKKISKNLVQVDCVAGCFFMAKVIALKMIGYLDENVFMYNEENLLGIRCKKYGYKEIMVTDQYYFHNHKKSTKKLSFYEKIKVTEKSYQSRKYMCKTYYPKRLLFPLWCIEMINRLYLAGCYLYGKIKK